MADTTAIDDHIAALPNERRAAMEEIRATIRAAAPDATEVISYKMPAFRSHGRMLVWYEAFASHYSIFPATEALRTELGDELAPYLHGKGTIRFPADEPLPTGLIARIVAIRLAENAAVR